MENLEEFWILCFHLFLKNEIEKNGRTIYMASVRVLGASIVFFLLALGYYLYISIVYNFHFVQKWNK